MNDHYSPEWGAEHCASLIRRLNKPTGPVDVVLDTDAYNEVDDQYAMALLINSADQLRLKAIYAAPFHNHKSTGPKDGMEKSYDEILTVLELMGRQELGHLVYKGSESFLPGENQPVSSPAARHLAELASGYSAEDPLYVIAIAAITNIASALLIAPDIRDKMVVIWLGGHALDWPDTGEFNMRQDIAAVRVVFGCGVPLVLLPCDGVVSGFSVSGAELERWLQGKNKLCDYLVDASAQESREDGLPHCWSRVIWDVAAVAWLLQGDLMLDRLEFSPIPGYDNHYSFDKRRHLIRYVYHIKRDNLLALMIRVLTQ